MLDFRAFSYAYALPQLCGSVKGLLEVIKKRLQAWNYCNIHTIPGYVIVFSHFAEGFKLIYQF